MKYELPEAPPKVLEVTFRGEEFKFVLRQVTLAESDAHDDKVASFLKDARNFKMGKSKQRELYLQTFDLLCSEFPSEETLGPVKLEQLDLLTEKLNELKNGKVQKENRKERRRKKKQR